MADTKGAGAMTTKLYYGDNGVHEFWQDKTGDHCIIRNHGEKSWVCVMLNGKPAPEDTAKMKRVKKDSCFHKWYGLGAATANDLVNRIKKQYDIALERDYSQRWRGKVPMKLEAA